jgi:hypothetical protein
MKAMLENIRMEWTRVGTSSFFLEKGASTPASASIDASIE